MTEFRARIFVPTAGLLMLALGAVAHAGTNDINGTQATTDSACVAPIPFFNKLDCSYNASDPTGFGTDGWQGPTAAAHYYAPGDAPGVDNPPDGGDGGPKTELPITGTVTIDDGGTPSCADDTIAGDVSLGEGTRAFDGGQGAVGEEHWGNGDIVFSWAAAAVSSGVANGAGGCDYEIASDGFPPRLEEAGGPGLFPVDASVDAPGFYVAPGTSGVAFGTEGNLGVYVPVTVGGGWSCDKNAVGDACEIGDGFGFLEGGPHFKGTREAMENVLLSISTDSSGDITNGEAYVINETKIFNVDPDPVNSWDGTRWQFTGSCVNCSLVSDDAYVILVGEANVVLDIGANDSDVLDNPTVTITSSPSQGSTDPGITGSGGPINSITATYTPDGGTGGPYIETFQYTADDGSNPPATATVTVDVQTDAPPVANPATINDISTVGVDPSTVSGSFNALTDFANSPGNDGSVTDVTAAGTGTSGINGDNVTYTPAATFFTGMDTFDYTITDTVTTDPQPQPATNTVTVNIADATPVAPDESETTDQGVAVDIDLSPTPGNGSVAQHSFSISTNAANGTCELNGLTVTYTPDAEFFGEDSCEYTVTDGDGSEATGTVTITVNEVSDLEIKLPGGKALGPWTLILLLGLPLLRRRRRA